MDKLSLFDKERDNDNWKRKAYHMFFSQYNSEFQKLDAVQQQRIIELSGGIVALVAFDDGNYRDNDNGGASPIFLWHKEGCYFSLENQHQVIMWNEAGKEE